MDVKTIEEKDGVIYLPLIISEGIPGESWVGRLKKKGYSLGRDTKNALRSKEFIANKGAKYQIAIIRGSAVSERPKTSEIIAKAEQSSLVKLEKSNVEVACLVREILSDNNLRDLRLHWVVTMHDPIKDTVGNKVRFNIDTLEGFGVEDESSSVKDAEWTSGGGFAFLVPQL